MGWPGPQKPPILTYWMQLLDLHEGYGLFWIEDASQLEAKEKKIFIVQWVKVPFRGFYWKIPFWTRWRPKRPSSFNINHMGHLATFLSFFYIFVERWYLRWFIHTRGYHFFAPFSLFLWGGISPMLDLTQNVQRVLLKGLLGAHFIRASSLWMLSLGHSL